MVIAGIDYSLRGPAICVFKGEGDFDFKHCKFYFLTDTKKYANTFLKNIIMSVRDMIQFPLGLLMSVLVARKSH